MSLINFIIHVGLMICALLVAASVSTPVRACFPSVEFDELLRNPNETDIPFFIEILNAWRTRARCHVVSAERTLELFEELSFHPSQKQIGEMLQTAKSLSRKGNRHTSGLTFGEFCVLAADLKRFRVSSFTTPTFLNGSVNHLNSLQKFNSRNVQKLASGKTSNGTGVKLGRAKSMNNVDNCRKLKNNDTTAPVEVFLGGSCNPTTWRADVAIPALKELGISFYNPQVSDWTPDLIELEHRAKEKARVLFFVMDSETRASAGAIEAAHIAGQNCKQLVLVLHPYKENQTILNERISKQEYTDLMRNQLILRELVTRRGLPVLNDIPSGLQRTKEILVGIRDPPSNIASILVVVRGAFNRISPVNETISIEQCQRALSYLGYSQSVLNIDNLKKIVASRKDFLNALQNGSSLQNSGSLQNCGSLQNSDSLKNSSSLQNCSSLKTNNRVNCTPSQSLAATDLSNFTNTKLPFIDFELFCVVAAYLSVLQQEIHESGCISPIKGMDVPAPPVYLTNMQSDEGFTIDYYSTVTVSHNTNSTNATTSNDGCQSEQNRDSGTSSPQIVDMCKKSFSGIFAVGKVDIANNSGHPLNASSSSVPAEEESDSNDSVFSSSSSINSNIVNLTSTELPPFLAAALDFRDVYLGGSCLLRTTWRQELAIPYFKSQGVTFHLPALHESLTPSSALDLPSSVFDEPSSLSIHERTFVRTRRKSPAGLNTSRQNSSGDGGHESQINEEDKFKRQELFSSWSLSSARTNLFNPSLLDSSRVLLFVITNETRSLAPMTLAAHCIGLMYNVVLAVQMLPDDCVIGEEKLTPTAIKDYNRGRAYLIDLATRQGVPVFNEIKPALECTVEKVKAFNSRNRL